MSSNIDQRIVQMKFDNQQFESGVQSSLKSLDNLKKGLELDGVGKGIASMSAGIEALSGKFSALSIVGITAIQNLTNSAMNFGKNIVKSLTVDPVKAGLSEYETKMNAIQTILTNTQSKGTNLTDVNKALSELNEYSDKTIYNFAEMSRNIGTFTAAGVDLDTSVQSIKGIANLAAGSGSNAQQASTAMYQLSQALAAGSVKLQDWNSVVNAGMGGELFQKALEKTAAGLGKGRDMSVSFRESLQDGWITTEVLTKTLQDFANDPSLIKAATQVKTFTQLYDTMKESVQSGWAVSWENIIGNKDEAAKTLTAINDAFGQIAGASADARNEMLKFWHDNGGRDALIEAISNSFKALSAVIGPVVDGFNEIFPPMTGKRLVELSETIRDLTAKFTFSAETIEKIKATFKGFFAMVSIGGQILSALAKSLLSVLGVVSPMGASILDVTSYIGYFFIGLNKTLQASDAITISFTKVIDVIKGLAYEIMGFVSGASAAIDAFLNPLFITDTMKMRDATGGVTGEFGKLMDKLNETTPALVTYRKGLKGIIGDNIGEPLKALWEKFSGGNEILIKLRDNIVKFVKSLTLNDVLAALTSGAFVAFILQLKSVAKAGGSFLDNLIGVFGGVKDALKAYQTELQASALLKIAIAIGLLSAALIALSYIDPAKIGPALAAITVLFADMVGVLTGFSKVVGSKSAAVSIAIISAAMISLSIALLILSIALKKVADIDSGDLGKGVTTIAALSAIMVGIAAGLKKQQGPMIKASIALMLFGAAIHILVGAISKIGNLKPEVLGQGLMGLMMLVGTLALMLATKQFKSISVKSGLGLIGIAAAILVMASAVKKFGEIKPDVMEQGLTALGTVLVSMAIFLALVGEPKKLIAMGVGMVAIAASMLIFASALGKMGALKPDELDRGLKGLGVSLAIIAVAMRIMPKGMLMQAVALGMVAASVLLLANALTTLGKFKMDEIKSSLIMLSASLATIVVAVNLMKGAIAGALALSIVVGALTLLVPVLMMLGSMSLPSIVGALIALAGVFTIIGLAGVLLAPVILPIIAISGAIALLGVGFLAAGAGITMFAAGLIALGGAGAVGVQVIVNFVTAVLNLIPLAVQKLGEGLVLFAQAILTGAPLLIQALSTVLYSLIPVITGTIPSLVNAFMVMIDAILVSISEHLPSMIESGWSMIKSFVQGIADNIGEIVAAGVTIVTNFINGLAENLPDLIDAGTNLILSFIESLAASIEKNTPRMIIAVKKLLKAIINAAMLIFGTMATDFKTAGGKVITAFKESISSKVGDVVDVIKTIPSKALSAVKVYVGDFFDVGLNVVKGFLNGASAAISGVSDAGKAIGKAVITAASKTLGVESPSKEFAWIGKMVDVGMADGVDKNADKPITSMDGMTQAAIDAAKGNMNTSTGEQVGSDFATGAATGISSNSGKVADAVKTAFELAVEAMDDKKYYNQLTLEEELKNWQVLQAAYKVGTEERKKADREVYRVKMELIKASADEEKQAYDNSTKWIANEKYYNRLSLKQELAAWQRVSKAHAAYTDEHIQAEKEIYRVKNELIEKQKTIDKDYYDSTKSINDKLKSDIKSLNDEYENALASKEKSLYDSYGLFDAATDEDVADGAQLIKNLRSQVDALETYRENINELTSKGVSSGLIDELEELGPKSLSQIQAINNMSKSELETYVHLWNDKHEEAKLQSTSEMEDLKNENLLKIEELNKQSEIDLDTYKQIWLTATSDLSAGVIEGMETLNAEVATSVETLKTETVAEVTDMVAKVTDVIKRNDWVLVGENIVLGIRDGIRNKIPMVIQESQRMALSALQSARNALEEKSPSKAFEEVGEYADLGFVNGLKKYSGLVSDEGGNIGNTALDAIQKAISGMYDLINGDMDMVPVIRPVLDLTDVSSGLASFFGNKQTLNVSDATIKAGNIASAANQNGVNSTSNTSTNNSSIVLNNTYNVRSDSDIRKISQDLKNTMNRYANAKGVLV